MRLSFLAIAIAFTGMSGTLQASKPVATDIHKVRSGETAGKIAQKYGLSLAQLGTMNPKINLSKLSIGAALKVGGGKKAPRTPKATVLPALPFVSESRALPPEPVRALPIIPALGPAVLVHLERILPATLKINVPGSTSLNTSSGMGSSSSLAFEIRPILPSGENVDSMLASNLDAAFEPADPMHLDLLWPVETRTISSAWGPRIRSRVVRAKRDAKKRIRVRYRGNHKGIDLTAPKGTDVYAALDGQVITATKHRLYGNYVVVDHGNGVVTLYAHHTANFVREGDIVRRGQKIGEVGRTGNATGPHLHFELRMDGVHQNPLPVLNDTEEIPADLVALNQAATPVTRR